MLGKIKSSLIIVILMFLISGCYRSGPPATTHIYNFYNVTNDTGNCTVAGSDMEIQYNTNGSLDASSDLYWNNTEKLLGVQGYGMFSDTFNKSELMGYSNVKIGAFSGAIGWGTITFESNAPLGADTIWAIDNGGGNIRVYEETPGSDGYCRFRISSENVRIGEPVPGRVLPLDVTGDITARNNLNVSGRFYPKELEQATEPTNGGGAGQIDIGELVVWDDTDNTDLWLVFNDDGNVVKIQLI